MKKLTLLALSLFAFSIASANVTFEATIKKNDQVITLNPTVLSQDNNTIVYDIDGIKYKAVLVQYSNNEEGKAVATIEFSEIDSNGTETLLASPTLQVPGTITLGTNSDYELKITIQ